MIPSATSAVRPCPFGGHYHQRGIALEGCDTHLPEADSILAFLCFVLVFDGLDDFSLAFGQIFHRHDSAL